MPYLIDPRLPADLPVMVYPATRERIGQVPRFGLVEAELTGRGHSRRLNPCDADCRLAIEPILEARGLTVRDLCSRAPRGPREPVQPVEAPPLGEAGITSDLVEAGSRRLMIAAAVAPDVIAACLPEVVGQRLAGPDKTVLLGVAADRWIVGATKQIKAGVRAIEKQLRDPVIVEFAPLIVETPDEQAYNVIALQRLATVATDAELTRGGVSWPVMLGAQTEVLIAGASGMERLPGRYMLAPFAAILPSNNPQSFAPSPDYPRELQERDYQTDQAERAKVITNAQNWIAALVLNSNPDAVNGPPIVDPEGRVLGGNSRAMSTARFAAANPDTYANALRQALRSHCAAFGLDGVELDNATLAGLTLVRVIEGQIDPRTISRALNRALTLELGRGAASVTMGKLIPPDLLAQLADDVTDSTLREILRKNSTEVIGALRRSGFITAQNAPVYVTKTGELSNRAAQDIEDALTGLFVGSTELYNTIKPRLLAVITRLAPGLLALAEGTDYAPDIEDARAALPDATAWLGLSQVELDREVTTGALFAGIDRPALTKPAVARWVLWWMQASRSPAVAARVVRDFVALANEAPGLFGPRGRDVPEMIRILKMQPFDAADPAAAWAAYVRDGLPFEGLGDRKRNPSSPASERVSYVPPRAVQHAAALALAVRAAAPSSERGGTAIGLARARDLAHGRAVSRETLQRMASFFARHEIDKRGASWGRRGKGWQAWNLWGGDAGRDWARAMLDERRDNPPRKGKKVDQYIEPKSLGRGQFVEFWPECGSVFDDCAAVLYFSRKNLREADAAPWEVLQMSHRAAALDITYFWNGDLNSRFERLLLIGAEGRALHNREVRRFTLGWWIAQATQAIDPEVELKRLATVARGMGSYQLLYLSPLPGKNDPLVVLDMTEGAKHRSDDIARLFFQDLSRETGAAVFEGRKWYVNGSEWGQHFPPAVRNGTFRFSEIATSADKTTRVFTCDADPRIASNRAPDNGLHHALVNVGSPLHSRPPHPTFQRAMKRLNVAEVAASFQIDDQPYTITLQRKYDMDGLSGVFLWPRQASDRLGPTAGASPAPVEKTAKPRKKTISAADVLDAPAPLDVTQPPAAPAPLDEPGAFDALDTPAPLDEPGAFDALDTPAPLDEPGALDALDTPAPLDEPGALDAAAVANLDREAVREAVAEFAPLARRPRKADRRTYTAQDIRDDLPPPPPQPDRDTIEARIVRKVLRGVGEWAQVHPDDDTARELGGILIALAAESQLAERGARAGVTVGDQAFAHMYWAAHPPTDPDKWNAGLVAAAQAAILLAKGQTQAAIDMLSPSRRPNPIPVWAETLLQLARLITALSAAGSATVAINQAALAGDTLATLDAEPVETPDTGRP